MLVKLYFKLNWILGLGGSGGCLMTSITFDLTECSFTYLVASSGLILNKESPVPADAREWNPFVIVKLSSSAVSYTHLTLPTIHLV